MKYIDTSGHIIETGFDVLSAGYSLKELWQNPSWANLGFLLWDIGTVLYPTVPGSYVVKGGKVLDVLDSNKGLLGIAEGAGKADTIVWNTWESYQKVIKTVNGEEKVYAKIGDRLYTHHAVDRMMPYGKTTYGRSVSPKFVEDVLKHGQLVKTYDVDGVTRQV